MKGEHQQFIYLPCGLLYCRLLLANFQISSPWSDALSQFLNFDSETWGIRIKEQINTLVFFLNNKLRPHYWSGPRNLHVKNYYLTWRVTLIFYNYDALLVSYTYKQCITEASAEALLY